MFISEENVTKNQKKKTKIDKDFELYKVFVYSFLCKNEKIFIKILELFKSLCVVKCVNATDTHQKHYSVKIGSIFFLIF